MTLALGLALVVLAIGGVLAVLADTVGAVRQLGVACLVTPVVCLGWLCVPVGVHLTVGGLEHGELFWLGVGVGVLAAGVFVVELSLRSSAGVSGAEQKASDVILTQGIVALGQQALTVLLYTLLLDGGAFAGLRPRLPRLRGRGGNPAGLTVEGVDEVGSTLSEMGVGGDDRARRPPRPCRPEGVNPATMGVVRHRSLLPCGLSSSTTPQSSGPPWG